MTPRDDEDTEQLDEIVVVGSRIKRAEVEGPAPVTVITREDIDREGFQTVGDALQSLNQNTTASFTGDLATAGFTPNAQVVNLRNLGPGYTLTLINGRRPAQYPQPYNRDNNVVNVRAIPTGVIERIEVLTGGASAIYGSDAIAGVVNIVTRTNYDGHSVRGTVGTTAEGGGDSVNFEFTGGTTGDRWSTVYGLQYGYVEPVFADQREFLADSRNGPLGPNFTNPALSLVALRVSAHPSGPTNHNAYYPGQEACDAFGYTTRTTATRGLYCGSFTQVASRSISNKHEFYSAYGYGTFDVSDTTQLFAQATYYGADSTASNGTEFWGTSGDQFNRNANNAQTAAYFDPQFGHLVQLQRIFNPFELGGPEAASHAVRRKHLRHHGGRVGHDVLRPLRLGSLRLLRLLRLHRRPPAPAGPGRAQLLPRHAGRLRQRLPGLHARPRALVEPDHPGNLPLVLHARDQRGRTPTRPRSTSTCRATSSNCRPAPWAWPPCSKPAARAWTCVRIRAPTSCVRSTARPSTT